MKAATFSDELYDCGYVISIHAAREGGDCRALAAKKLGMKISIHAAREGGDQPEQLRFYRHYHFNPRRP